MFDADNIEDLLREKVREALPTMEAAEALADFRASEAYRVLSRMAAEMAEEARRAFLHDIDLTDQRAVARAHHVMLFHECFVRWIDQAIAEGEAKRAELRELEKLAPGRPT